MHVLHLPVESAFVAQQRGGDRFRGWGEQMYMLASIYNTINILKYITILANSDPDGPRPDMPEPYPIPDDIERKKHLKEKPGTFGFMAKTLLAKAKKRKAAAAND